MRSGTKRKNKRKSEQGRRPEMNRATAQNERNTDVFHPNEAGRDNDFKKSMQPPSLFLESFPVFFHFAL
jgi:hypothetical protein